MTKENPNPLEKIITGLNAGPEKFTKDVDDWAHDALDYVRFKLKSDPSIRLELRNPTWKGIKNNGLQLAGLSFNVGIFLAKQAVNLVRKPIALVKNTLKATAISADLIWNKLAGNTPADVCNLQALKNTGAEILRNTRDTVIAYGTTALALSGFGAPIAVGIGAASMGISFGSISFGAISLGTMHMGALGSAHIAANVSGLNPVVQNLHQGLVQANTLSSTGATGIAVDVETGVKVGYLGAEHLLTNPNKAKENSSLKEAHTKLVKAHAAFKSASTLALKREALTNVERLQHTLKTSQLEQSTVGTGIKYTNKFFGDIGRAAGILPKNNQGGHGH